MAQFSQLIRPLGRLFASRVPQRNESFVKMAYRAVLLREADADGLKHYAALLDAGSLQHADVLQELLGSGNFPHNYSIEKDDQYAGFLSEEVKQRSIDLATHVPFSAADMDNSVPGLVGLEYYEFHKARFLEMMNALAFVEQTLKGPLKILEVGSIFSTKIAHTLFADSRISTIDILEVDQIGYGDVFALKDLVNRHYKVDLVKDDLEKVQLEEQGKFDVVLLCEVIEHLLVNPTKILAFLLRQLKPGGFIYVTTPNAFKRDNVRMFNQRRMPFPVYPMTFSHEDAFMFHVREFGMTELLQSARSAGGTVEAFYFSSCWDEPSAAQTMAPHELGNLVALIQRPHD